MFIRYNTGSCIEYTPLPRIFFCTTFSEVRLTAIFTDAVGANLHALPSLNQRATNRMFRLLSLISLLLLILCDATGLSAQSLALFDIDSSAFPIMKAKVYAFDVLGQPIRLSASNIALREQGTARTVVSLTCPQAVAPQPISSLLVIDVSLSMLGMHAGITNLDLAKAAATSWIRALPQGQSQCAISSFDDQNYLHQDFTTDRTKMLAALTTLNPFGSSD